VDSPACRDPLDPRDHLETKDLLGPPDPLDLEDLPVLLVLLVRMVWVACPDPSDPLDLVDAVARWDLLDPQDLPVSQALPAPPAADSTWASSPSPPRRRPPIPSVCSAPTTPT